MVQSLSGGSKVDSRRLVAVGTMMAEAEAAGLAVSHGRSRHEGSGPATDPKGGAMFKPTAATTRSPRTARR